MSDAPETIWAGGREPEWFFDDPSDHRDGGYAEYTRTDIAQAHIDAIDSLAMFLSVPAQARIDAIDWRLMFLSVHDRMRKAGESKEMGARWFSQAARKALKDTTNE